MYMPIKGARMRVLIIDDEPLSRNAVENAVGGRKDVESLDSAADAVEALEMLEKKSYDVLLLDIQMPELSGIALADRLNNQRAASPAIIFVTAHDQHAVAAFKKHAVDYVLKPFQSEEFGRLLMWQNTGRRANGRRN